MLYLGDIKSYKKLEIEVKKVTKVYFRAPFAVASKWRPTRVCDGDRSVKHSVRTVCTLHANLPYAFVVIAVPTKIP